MKYTIGEIKKLNVAPSTLRYYDKEVFLNANSVLIKTPPQMMNHLKI